MGRLLLNTILLQHGFPLVIIRDSDDKFERHGYMGAMFDGFSGDLRPFIGAINSHLIGTINIVSLSFADTNFMYSFYDHEMKK